MAATTHPYYIHELLAEEQCTVLSWVENSALGLETEFNILRCFWFENIGLKTNNGEYHRELKTICHWPISFPCVDQETDWLTRIT